MLFIVSYDVRQTSPLWLPLNATSAWIGRGPEALVLSGTAVELAWLRSFMSWPNAHLPPSSCGFCVRLSGEARCVCRTESVQDLSSSIRVLTALRETKHPFFADEGTTVLGGGGGRLLSPRKTS